LIHRRTEAPLAKASGGHMGRGAHHDRDGISSARLALNQVSVQGGRSGISLPSLGIKDLQQWVQHMSGTTAVGGRRAADDGREQGTGGLEVADAVLGKRPHVRVVVDGFDQRDERAEHRRDRH
jgi:hypothetical protein